MFAIVGAGSIGRLFAYRLCTDNCFFLSTRGFNKNNSSNLSRTKPTDVNQHIDTHQSVSDKSSASPPENTSFNVIDDRSTFRLNVPTFYTARHELGDYEKPRAVLLCTKSYDAVKAATDLDAALPSDVPFVLMQNGMGSQQNIVRRLVHRPVFAAITTSGANINSNDELILAGDGTTQFGPLNDAALSDSKALFKLLQDASSNAFVFNEKIDLALYKKLIINCGINAFTAIENCTNGEIVDTKSFSQLWPTLLKELSALAKNVGLPNSTRSIEQEILSVSSATSNNISSMLQDIRAEKQTEIDDINGFAAKFLNECGLDAIANKTLTEKVHALRR